MANLDENQFVLLPTRQGIDRLDLRPYMIDEGIAIDHSLEEGGWELTVSVADPFGRIRNHPIFGEDKTNEIPEIDVEFDGYWFRMRSLSRAADGSLTMVFIDRHIDRIAHKRKPIVTSRAKATRREFIVARVESLGIKRSYCPELHVKKKILKPDDEELAEERGPDTSPGSGDPDSDSSSNSGGGVSGSVTIKGTKATDAQKSQINRALSVASNLNAPHRAVLAMVCAGIGESGFAPIMNTAGSPYGGVFQGNVRGGVFSIDDTEEMARCFLQGGKGFQAGGAISLAKQGVDPGEIATRVEASGKAGSFYGQWRSEAEKIIDAYKGGSFGGSGTTAKSVLYVGDSLSVGTVEYLKKKLGSGVVVFDGDEGRSSATCLNVLKDKMKNSYQVVIFDAGTNDDFTKPKEYLETLKKVKREVGDANLVIFTLNKGSATAPQVEKMNLSVTEIALMNGVSVVDWAEKDSLLGGDGIHPTDAGYKKRADMTANIVNPLVTSSDGGDGGSRTVAIAYQFKVGEMQEDGTRENWWEGILRLADEIRIRAFFDRGRFILMSETELAKSKHVATINASNKEVTAISWDFDNGDEEKRLTVELQCTRWAFPPGASVNVTGEGRFNGRYIVVSKQGSAFEPTATIDLRRALPEMPEPAHEVRTITDDPEEDEVSGADLDFDYSGSPKQIIDEEVIPLAKKHGMNTGVTVAMVEAANAAHGPTVAGSRSDHQGPGDQAWAADMSNGSSPTPEMDKLARDLATKFGIPWSGSGAVSHTTRGFRFQLIYRSNVGGNHYNHNHMGIRKV